MGFDHNNNCNDHHLNLGLGFAAVKKAAITNSTITNTTNNLEPSLTLALSNSLDHNLININNNNSRPSIIDMNNNMIADHGAYGRQASPPHSAVSSFSGGGGGRVVKRERDVASSEEVEAEHEKGSNNSRGISDEDEDGSNGRKKLRLTKEQSALLEESFKQHSTLNPKQKQALARQLNLRARQVEVWFQNRRARTKLKQTEVDCEFLKKCCETLTDENRRLQKELQELKALKLAQPLYMHMPAATLSMCPSCERVGSSAAAGSAGDLAGAVPGAGPKMSQFSMAHHHPKQHFYSPFTNPSAAC